MKITSAIYLVFTATLFLLLPISCLYRDCIDRLTKHPLIAFKLPDVGDFCNCRDAMHCISTYPQLRTYTYLHPGTIADHVSGDLSVNKTDFNALWDNAAFVGLSCFFAWKSLSQLENQGRFVAKQALRFDTMLTG